MITFNEGELEIAMITANRPEFVAEWLEKCYDQMNRRNIHFSIYDSSENDDTKRFISDFKSKHNDTEIEYHFVDMAVLFTYTYKPMIPLLNSKAKYVWVTGDSLYYDLDLMDKKLFPYLKNDIDYAVLCIQGNEENDGKMYTDRNELVKECFVSMTCAGASIIKTSIFEKLKCSAEYRYDCDSKYEHNEGFSWLGYFLEAYAEKDYRAVFCAVPSIAIKPDKKVFCWAKKYYSFWIGDLCDLLDTLSAKYKDTDAILRETWKWVPLDTVFACRFARKSGDLNPETCKKFKENGKWYRCVRHGGRMERFAYASDEEVDELFEQEFEVEKADFKKLCYRNIKKIKDMSMGRDLWIYGAGLGGGILAECLEEHDIPICGFLDREAKKIKSKKGLDVKEIDEVDLTKCYIVVGMRYPTAFCVIPFLERGVERKYILNISAECD